MSYLVITTLLLFIISPKVRLPAVRVVVSLFVLVSFMRVNALVSGTAWAWAGSPLASFGVKFHLFVAVNDVFRVVPLAVTVGNVHSASRYTRTD